MSIAGPSGALSADDFFRRARARLSLTLPPDVFARAARTGDHAVDGQSIPTSSRPPHAAAVLVPIVDHRDEAATVLLTKRVETLRAHSGQIAFPGGKIDAGDASPAEAALREAWEEIGLDRGQVTPIGYLDPYLTGTGYLVVPVVALVAPPLRLELNPDEVGDAFEVPLDFLMEPANHQRQSRDLGGRLRSFYAMPYAERFIWGATAGMLRNLFEKLYL